MADKRKVRTGFVWVGKDGKGQPNITEVDLNDPTIKGQEHKLEPLAEKKGAKKKVAKPISSPSDRRGGASEGRR